MRERRVAETAANSGLIEMSFVFAVFSQYLFKAKTLALTKMHLTVIKTKQKTKKIERENFAVNLHFLYDLYFEKSRKGHW